MKNQKYTLEEIKLFYANTNNSQFLDYLLVQLQELKEFASDVGTAVRLEDILMKIKSGKVSLNFMHPKHSELKPENFVSEYLIYLSKYEKALSNYKNFSETYNDVMKQYFLLSEKDKKNILKHSENPEVLKDFLNPSKYEQLIKILEFESFLIKEIDQFLLIKNRIINPDSGKGKEKYQSVINDTFKQLTEFKITQSSERKSNDTIPDINIRKISPEANQSLLPDPVKRPGILKKTQSSQNQSSVDNLEKPSIPTFQQ